MMNKTTRQIVPKTPVNPQPQPAVESASQPLTQTVVRPRPTRVEVHGASLSAEKGGRGTTPPSATQGRPTDQAVDDGDDAVERAISLQKTTAAHDSRVHAVETDAASNPSGGPLGWMWAQLERAQEKPRDKPSAKK